MPYEVRAGKVTDMKTLKSMQKLRRDMEKAMQQHQRRRSRGQLDGLPFKNRSIKEYMNSGTAGGGVSGPIKGSTIVKINKSPSQAQIIGGANTN